VGSVVEGGGALTLEAQNGIYLRAAQVNAQGALRLHAGGDVLLQAGQSSQSLAEGHQSSSRGLLSRSTTTTRSSSERRTAQASVLQGQSVAVTGRNVVSVGTRFESTGGALHIEGADDTLLYATQDYQRSASSSQTSRRILGVSADTSNHSSSSAQTVAVRSALISDQAVRIGVGERTELVGASVQAPQIAFVRSQGAASDAAGALHLGAAQETDQASQRSTRTSLGLWQQQADSGHERNSAQMTELLGAVQIAPDIVLSIELPREVNANHPGPAPSLQAQVQQLASRNPGLAYLEQLQNHPAVNWSELELAQRSWDYRQQGLTPAGAALLAVAVGWATGGMGANLIGAPAQGLSGLKANAAFTSLSSQAAIGLVNNRGDVGATLRQLASSEAVRATLAAALTAGAMAQWGDMQTMRELAGSNGVPQRLAHNLIDAGGRALTSTAIEGGDLEAALRRALLGGAVDTVHGAAASHIKALESQWLAHKLAHALAGCAAGAAAGGECRDGAIGAAVGEAVAQLLPPANRIAYSPAEQRDIIALSQLVAGAAAAYTGGDAQAAITTARVAVENNAFKPLIVGLAWLVDRGLTAYQASQDLAAIRDGSKTVQQVAQERGEEYVVNVILGNLGRVGIRAVKEGGLWVQSRADDAAQRLNQSQRQQAESIQAPGLTEAEKRAASFPTGHSQLGHIFRNAPGHLADTPANRQLLTDVASNSANRVGVDRFGNVWFSLTRADGTQVWASARNGVIQNGGLNQVPQAFPNIVGP
jgi:filamentous hemagglutinin